MRNIILLGASTLLTGSLFAQNQIQLPESMDPTIDRSVVPGISGTTFGNRGGMACDDFDRAALGPNWTPLGGAPEIFNNRFGGPSGNNYAEYTGATAAHDTAVITIDLPDNPSGLSYGAAVVGLGGTQNLYTKVQGSGSYTNIGAYVGFNGGGSGGYGGFFAITAVAGGWAHFYVDPNSGGDVMVVDLDENRDGVVDYTYTYPGLLAAFPAGTFGTGVGLGCFDSGAGAADDFDLNGGCGGPAGLTVSAFGPCGQPGSGLTATGASPGGLVGFAWSQTMAPSTIGGASCVGTMVDLRRPKPIATVSADNMGTALVAPGGGIPAPGCGLILIQVIDFVTCDVSNVLPI